MRSTPAFLFAAAVAFPALAQSKPPPDVQEIPIEIPDPTPTGLLLAWKPALLSVRLDTGKGSQFGSDKLQPLRFLGRYTAQFTPNKPYFGRVELEGGKFETEDQGIGSTGADITARLLVGAATRFTSGVLLVASAGFLTRYQWGSAVGGAPKIGIWGVDSNIELAIRLFPTITLSLYVEGAIAPFPYLAQKNLGDLSDASEARARVQVSMDLSRSVVVDIGYDFTRWHASFVSSTILGNTSPDQALLIESREHAATLGLRYKM